MIDRNLIIDNAYQQIFGNQNPGVQPSSNNPDMQPHKVSNSIQFGQDPSTKLGSSKPANSDQDQDVVLQQHKINEEQLYKFIFQTENLQNQQSSH